MADSSSEEKNIIELKEEIKQKSLSNAVSSLESVASLEEEEPLLILKEDIKQKNNCSINLKKTYEQLQCSDENLYSKECNKFMLKKRVN